MLLAIPSTIFRTEVTFWGLAGPALWGLCEGTARWSTSAESRWFGVPQQHQGQVTGESCPIRTSIYGGALLSKEHQPDPTWHQGSPSLQCQSISINININQMNVGGSNWRWWDWWNHVESSWLPPAAQLPKACHVFVGIARPILLITIAIHCYRVTTPSGNQMW